MWRFFHALLVVTLMTICISVAGNTSADSRRAAEVKVRVTGFGATLLDARQDAIRKALQKILTQRVVAERIIKNDKIIVDQILSSMNGFISGFKEVSIKRVSSGIELKADVTVSTSTVENYIATRAGTKSSVEGSALFAEVNRIQLQREFFSNYIDRLFRGFPSAVLRADVTRIRPSSDGSKIQIRIRLAPNRDWLRQLRQGVASIAVANEKGFGIRGVKDLEEPPGSLQLCFPTGRRRQANSRRRRLNRKSIEYHCFWLPNASYGANFLQETKKITRRIGFSLGNLGFALRFIDGSRQSVHTETCGVAFITRKRPTLFSQRSSKPYKRSILDFGPQDFRFELASSGFTDLRRARNVVVVPFLSGNIAYISPGLGSLERFLRQPNVVITNLLGDEGESLCDILDKAALVLKN